MAFGQVVIGPPGSGKTTYCDGLQQFMRQLGRKVIVVNLDPANENATYDCAVNASELVTVEAVMDKHKLGPNGGLMYCMEVLEKNIDWLVKKLEPYKDHYMLFDCPGQVELYTHHQSVRNIFKHLTDDKNYRLTAVNLIDSYYCTSKSHYIAAVMLSLSMMLKVELPHVNVLSKIDMLHNFGQLDFNLEFYTDVGNMSYLLEHLEMGQLPARFKKLNKAFCSVIEDFSLVSFATLNIQDKASVLKVLNLVDKANGYCFASLDPSRSNAMQLVATPDPTPDFYRDMVVRDKENQK